MEKILSFLKNNMAIVVLIILVVLMMCQPNKNRKVTENFSSSTSLTEEECIKDIDKVYDSSFGPVCYNPTEITNWTPNVEKCCANRNGTMCYSHKDGNFCYLRNDLTEEMKQQCIGTSGFDVSERVKYSDGTISTWAYGPCKQEYVDFTDNDITGSRLEKITPVKTCNNDYDCGKTGDALNQCVSKKCYKSSTTGVGETLKQSSFCRRKVNPLDKNSDPRGTPLHSICDHKISTRIKTCSNGCAKGEDGFSYCKDSSGKINTNHLCITSDFNLNPNGYVANMLKNGKNALVSAAEIKKDTTINKKLLKSMEVKTNNSIKKCFMLDNTQTDLSALKRLVEGFLNLDKHYGQNSSSEEHFTQTDGNCKFNSKQRKILTEIIAAFNKGIANNQTEAYGNHNYENAKRKAIRLTNIYLTRAIKNGLFDEMVGDNKKDCFISELEKALNLNEGTIKVLDDDDEAVIESFSGYDYDENGRLREHSRGYGGGCYLVTALTKARLLSIGQVYQLKN